MQNKPVSIDCWRW